MTNVIRDLVWPKAELESFVESQLAISRNTFETVCAHIAEGHRSFKREPNEPIINPMAGMVATRDRNGNPRQSATMVIMGIPLDDTNRDQVMATIRSILVKQGAFAFFWLCEVVETTCKLEDMASLIAHTDMQSRANNPNHTDAIILHAEYLEPADLRRVRRLTYRATINPGTIVPTLGPFKLETGEHSGRFSRFLNPDSDMPGDRN